MIDASAHSAPWRRDYRALVAFMRGLDGRVFGWSREDLNCITLAAGAIQAQTGADRLAGLQWAGQREAMEMLAARGGLIPAVSDFLEPVALAHAVRGDIGAVPSALSGHGLVIVEGQSVIGIGETGRVWLPRKALVCAWSAVPLPAAGEG